MELVLPLKIIKDLVGLGRASYMVVMLTSLVTNEHNSSQTYLFSFKKLSQPHTSTKDGIMKITNDVFICLSNCCPNKFVVVSRDKLSALAVSFASASQLIFGVTFPCFDFHSTKEKRVKFKNQPLQFEQKSRVGSLSVRVLLSR
jgi:hypothetical protein